MQISSSCVSVISEISIARTTFGWANAFLPAPTPTLSMVNFWGSVNVCANAAMMAAPVGVIISPLFSVILIGMEADCTNRSVHGVGTAVSP